MLTKERVVGGFIPKGLRNAKFGLERRQSHMISGAVAIVALVVLVIGAILLGTSKPCSDSTEACKTAELRRKFGIALTTIGGVVLLPTAIFFLASLSAYITRPFDVMVGTSELARRGGFSGGYVPEEE